MTAARQRKGSKVDVPSTGYGTGTQMEMLQNAGGGIAAPPPGAPPPQIPGAAPPRDRVLDAANAPVGGLEGAFGPSQRPNEPITAGVPFGPGLSPRPDPAQDTDILLAAMYSLLPHPAIARLRRSDLQ